MSKWLSKLKKDADKLKEGYKEDWVAQSTSPGINYLYGKKGGILAGYSTLLYGPPKASKSTCAASFIGKMHQEDPEAICLYFDTEFREDNIEHWYEAFSIDRERLIVRQTNQPREIFDYIATDVAAMLQDGCPIKMIVIDSLAMIQGPKESNKDSSTDMVIGDLSAYFSTAFKMVIPIIRKYKIAAIYVQHVRDVMDPQKARYQKYHIPGGRALAHSTEWWLLVERINNKESKMFDTGRVDGAGNPIILGHHVRVTMENSSKSPPGRSVECALDYKKGFVNPHKEIADIAIGMKIVERPNNMSYVVGDKKWVGYDNFVTALKEDWDLQNLLIEKIKENDLT